MLNSYPELDKDTVQFLKDKGMHPSGLDYFNGKEIKFENL
jgi:hypothetical protein